MLAYAYWFEPDSVLYSTPLRRAWHRYDMECVLTDLWTHKPCFVHDVSLNSGWFLFSPVTPPLVFDQIISLRLG